MPGRPRVRRHGTDLQRGRRWTIAGNYGDVVRLVEHWDWENGIRTGNQPSPGDDALGILSLHNGDAAALSNGQPVEISPTAEGAVQRATAAAGVVGVLLRACAAAEPCLLATGGTVTCRLAPGVAVMPGANLTVDPHGFVTAGRGAPVVAVTLAAGNSDTDPLVACLLQRR